MPDSTFCPSPAPEGDDGVKSSAAGETAPDINDLHPSALAFLDHLGLPSVHPLCASASAGDVDPNAFSSLRPPTELSSVGVGAFELPPANPFYRAAGGSQPTPPPMGTMSIFDHHEDSTYDLLVTAYFMAMPSLLAMGELWLRLFAFVFAPLCLARLVHRELRVDAPKKKLRTSIDGKFDKTCAGSDGGMENIMTITICILGLLSSAVLFTDSLYVYEYGRTYGLSLVVLFSILGFRAAGTLGSRRNSVLFGAISTLVLTTALLFIRSDGGRWMDNLLRDWSDSSVKDITAKYNPLDHLPDLGIDVPTINPGLYYSSSNDFMKAVAENWPESSRTYDARSGATPYLVNGDQRTGIPFLVHSVPEQEYTRVWVTNPFDQESLALDIAFPLEENGDGNSPQRVHDSNKPVYLILHGLNGGSHEEYVKDFVSRRIAEGSTTVVMIARGMMDTSMSGWNVFHGARTGDVDIAARALRGALDTLAGSDPEVGRPILAGVGYSMGAIILSNYVARSGKNCALDAAMAVSGGLDMRQQLNFRRSMRLWQPMLTVGLREDILLGKYADHYKERLTREQFTNLLRVTSISHLDIEAIVTYNSFDDLVHYYSEMSAMGDRSPEFELRSIKDAENATDGNGWGWRNEGEWGRIADVSIPFAVLHALDDPLTGWRTVGTEDPIQLVNSGSGHLMLLLTKGGGHVGWPLGLNPKKHGWKWMNNAVRDFVTAVEASKRQWEQNKSAS